MAKLTTQNGRYLIRFQRDNNKRGTIRLGGVDAKTAHVIFSHVDALIGHAYSGVAIPSTTSAWLKGIGDKLHARIVKANLVSPRGSDSVPCLAPYIANYIKRRTDLKPATILNLRQAEASLLKHFGGKRDITTISKGEAKDWRRALAKEYAQATVAMHVKKARQIFDDAMDRDLLGSNPFRSIKAGSMKNDSRQQYVPALDIMRVIDACPDFEWKLIFALARFGGLRVPSETRSLRWADMWWDAGRMLIRSPKTEHHAGKATRVIPIFPELQPHLENTFERAEDGAEYVINLHRGENVSTTGRKIVERAGLNPWPKLYQNLRSSFETDLTARFPLHVACAWAGNTEAVAMSHYLHVTDAHFDQAVRRAPKSEPRLHDVSAVAAGSDMQNHPENAGDLHIQYPQGESNARQVLAENLHISAGALQKAIHRLNEAIPHIRAYDIHVLERELARSRYAGKGEA